MMYHSKTLKTKIKSTFARFYNLLGGISLSYKINTLIGNNCIILTYHRVVPQDKIQYGQHPGLYVEPKILKEHIEYFKKYFNIINLYDYMSDIKMHSSKFKSKLPYCILTFDDGYYDFYEYAFAVLKYYRAPATVFLATDFIGTNLWTWWDRLAYLLFQKDILKIQGTGIRLSSRSQLTDYLDGLGDSYGLKLEKSLAFLKNYKNEEIDKVLFELSTMWDINEVPPGRAFLSWEEVREMTQSGLVSFGSHGAGHKILTNLTDTEIQEELVNSKEKLISEKAADPAFLPFSYPNGDFNNKIIQMVSRCGFSLAVSTEVGWNKSSSDPFHLCRIPVHQPVTSTEAMLGCRIMGII